jgi:hypothetical protein
MTVSNIQLFNILREKLGENQAESLVQFVEEKVTSKFEENKSNFATKEDIANLKTELSVQIIDSQKKIILWTITSMTALLTIALSLVRVIK